MKTGDTGAGIKVYPPSVTRSILSAMDIINADLSDHLVLKQLAKNAGTNECTLKKGFKGIFSITIYQYLIQRRMHNAVYLLEATKFKEKEIAWQCGYETLSGFITTFRKYAGMSPGEFRRQCMVNQCRAGNNIYM